MYRPQFTQADLQRTLRQRLQRIEQVILNRLQYIGEKFVANARDNGEYNDITGNLRSSIGYLVLKDGQDVAEGGFEEASGGSDRAGGTSKGKAFIESLIADYPNGYVLIVVAGMEYAAAVESRGKDVLTASSTIAKRDLQKAIKQIKKQSR